MHCKPKLIFFSISIVLALSLISCGKSKYDVIPDVYVDFYINLSDPEFFDLNASGNSKIITSATNNWGVNSAGYNSNGIIVYRLFDEFYAFDRTCPHDYVVNAKSVKLNINGDFAVCPDCGTTYALSSFGTPYSGIGRYPLKNYKTGFNGQVVHVWHYL